MHVCANLGACACLSIHIVYVCVMLYKSCVTCIIIKIFLCLYTCMGEHIQLNGCQSQSHDRN